MSRLEIDQPYPVHIDLSRPAWAPRSVFGSMFTARDEYDLYQFVLEHGFGAAVKRGLETGERDRVRDRDRRIIRVARRWSGDPLRPPAHGNFVAGDVAAIRTAICEQSLQARHDQRADWVAAGQHPKVGSSVEHGMTLDLAAEHWMYAARSFFVPAHTLVGLVDCEMPSSDELEQLRLPVTDVAVYFSRDLTIPAELVAQDDTFEQLHHRTERAIPDVSGHVDGDEALPYVLPGPLTAADRRQPLQLCGVVLHADVDGRLDDVVLWLVTCPEHGIPNRHAIYGFLSRSLLRYVAVNVAAAITWGQWTAPSLDDLPDPRDPRFRDVIRSSRFRKAEPDGGALGVHVLDVKRTIMSRPPAERGGTHASPITHSRRAHWQQYRVGPRDDWHYERRFIPRVIVNPGNPDPGLTVYRLPPPP